MATSSFGPPKDPLLFDDKAPAGGLPLAVALAAADAERAPPPLPTAQPGGRPAVRPVSIRRAIFQNLWVAVLAAGIVIIPIISTSRLHTREPLQDVAWVSGAQPYVVPMGPGPMRYLYVLMTAAPWTEPGAAAAPHRRRRGLLSALSASAGLIDDTSAAAAFAGTGGSGAAAAPAGAGAAGPFLRGLKTHRRLPLAAMPDTSNSNSSSNSSTNSSSNGSDNSVRFIANGQEEQERGSPGSPQILVSLMRRDPAAAAANASGCITPRDIPGAVVSPGDAGLVAVTPPQACYLKDGAAVKCQMAFRAAALAAGSPPGDELLLVFQLPRSGAVALEFHAKDIGALGPAKEWLALGILALMLLGIASERIHRMWCAFIASFAMVSLLLWANMVPSLGTMVGWLDESTLGLLFGMMLIVGQLKRTGMFEVLCAWTLRVCRGRAWVLSVLLLYITAFVSAFLDNVTCMLLMGPITISLMAACGRSPVPLLVAQALLSNVGGTATMVGDPPNIIIGNALSRHIGFVDFLIHLAPGAIAATIPAVALLLWLSRRDLMGAIPFYSDCVEIANRYSIKDRNLLAKSGYVTTAVIIAFLTHPIHHLDPAVFAIMGSVLLCVLVSPTDSEGPLAAVELDMLLFFAGQFVLVEAASELGLINMLGGWLAAAIRAAPPQWRTIVAIEILLWGSAAISAVLDNIPFTITMVPIIEFLAAAGLGLELKTLAWTLAFGACFGGNATLIGASANIVTATMLDKAGHHITFNGWMRVGVPVTVVTLAAANLYLLRYAF